MDYRHGLRRHAAHAADSAHDTGQIKSIPAKAKQPSEMKAAFLQRLRERLGCRIGRPA
jgi:hypothetical protein